MYLSIEEFNNIYDIPDLYNFEKPYIIRGGCKNMTIFNDHSVISSVYNMFEDVKVDVEVYNSKEDMMNTKYSYTRENVFSDIYHDIMNDKYPYIYIAEFDVCNINPIMTKFKNDIDDTRYMEEALMFFGNNSYSGCHVHMSNDYILNQIYGKKIVYLFDYYDNKELKKGLKSNFITENFFHLDHNKLKVYKVEVNEGDCLTIPPWWWHAVKSDGIAFTITKTYMRSDMNYLTKYANK